MMLPYVIKGSLVIVIAFLLITGCSVESKLDELRVKYENKSSTYQQLVGRLRLLDQSIGIKGLVLINTPMLNTRDGTQIDVQSALTRWPQFSADMQKLMAIAKDLNIAYANIDVYATIWIIDQGGGVLGSDFGVLILKDDDVDRYASKLHAYKKVEGHSGVYVIAY